MIKFHDLLQTRDGVSVGALQESARTSFPALVAQSRFRAWSPGQPISKVGERLLIGVASYSAPDLELLDLLGEVIDRRGDQELRIDVFDTLDCKSHDDFDQYIPGIGRVFQTPAVGHWHNGALIERAWGRSGRDLIARVCSLQLARLQELWREHS